MSAVPNSIISVEEYLRAEAISSERHEYLGGYTYPVVENTTRNHARIERNLLRKIEDHLTGPCEVFGSGVKVHIQTAEGEDYFYYPDVSVTCEPDDDDQDTIESPVFLAEVISPSTERVDSREKWLYYRFNRLFAKYCCCIRIGPRDGSREKRAANGVSKSLKTKKES